jgi:hypothetical protein
MYNTHIIDRVSLFFWMKFVDIFYVNAVGCIGITYKPDLTNILLAVYVNIIYLYYYKIELAATCFTYKTKIQISEFTFHYKFVSLSSLSKDIVW